MPRGDNQLTNVFANLRDVTLQRLDVYHDHGHPVFYDSRYFAPTVNLWNTVPVIYADIEPGAPVKHPRFEDVTNGTLPPEYRVVGNVSGTHIPIAGERVLKGIVSFSDKEMEQLANAGDLSLSTGLSSPEAPDGRRRGATRIAGPVTPNHVLVFRRGACPNCYPNDNGAMFHNLERELEMDDESKGILKRIADALNKTSDPPQQYVNVAEHETLKKDVTAMKEAITELVNLIKTEKPPEKKPEQAPDADPEKENLKQELATLKAGRAKAKADAAWTTMKANLPEGWLGEKEAKTREEFEADPVAFSLKVIAFNNTKPGEKQAEGNNTPPGNSGEEPTSDEVAFKNLASEFEKKYGIRVV